MSILIEDASCGNISANGLNTNKAVAFGSTLSVTGAVTMASTVAVTGVLSANGGISGAVTASTLIGSTQALSGAGAVNVTTLTTKVTSTGANALTLADGTDGQIKFIVMVVDGGDATLTPTTKTGFSTIVFNDAGDGVGLVFTTTTGWIVFANNGVTIS